jgi:serine acetyltransferase
MKATAQFATDEGAVQSRRDLQSSDDSILKIATAVLRPTGCTWDPLSMVADSLHSSDAKSSIRSLLSSDFKLYCALHLGERAGRRHRLFLWFRSRGLLTLSVHRLGHYYLRRRASGESSLVLLGLRVLLPIARQLVIIIAKSDVAAHSIIDAGVYLSDNGYLIIGPQHIGKGTLIHDRVTIGVGAGGAGPPSIGENVWIGPDCVLYGDCRIGNGATILPGAVLSMSVPDNAVVGGNPGGIVRLNFDNSPLRRTLSSSVNPALLASL